jgi:NADPH:quinone reductase-like Zn-dependent oxidoreductase
LVGVAENVTVVPAHTGFEEALMATLTAFSGLTVIVMVFEVAGLPEGQPIFEVSTQETVLLFEGTKE